jgi:hypothetical protein
MPGKIASISAALTISIACADAGELTWLSPDKHRLLIQVDPLGLRRSNSPVSLEVDFAQLLRDAGVAGELDERTIEVMAHDSLGAPAAFDPSRDGYEKYLLPWRLDRCYGTTRGRLNFVMPDEKHTRFAVYLDTIDFTRGDRARGDPRRYPGLVGDGDFFREVWQKRETAACHFDAFCDLDGDGDLDLFRGGVEPSIHCLENVGENHLVDRGRLSSGGQVLTLPHNEKNHRSWVVPHFHDLDRDGDQDFFPSFTDGPHAHRIVWYENTTPAGGPLTFVDRGPLETASGTPIAGGQEAGGWFPSVVFVEDFDGEGGGDRDGRTDLLVGTNNRCYLYRNLGLDGRGGWRWAAAVAIQAGGEDIVLFNPCFALADVDADGDRDLFAAPQAGQILFYENVDASVPRGRPSFAKGVVVAYDEVYTIPSTHPRVTVADFTGDRLLDLAIDRAWELADLRALDGRDYGALLANVGTASSPKWSRVDAAGGAPHTEGFEICDALRQNVVLASDWDEDGKADCLAGDCDGFVWYFRNETGQRAPVFARGVRLRAGGKPLSLASSGGHARPDACDWNDDGRKDLVVSDGAGTVTVFLNEGTQAEVALGPGKPLEYWEDGAGPKPIDRGTRSHILVCDYNSDGRKDLLFCDQENPGFHFFENRGAPGEPRLAPAKRLQIAPCVRPNFGSFADWDGDGKKDLITCEFEHTVRLHKNIGSGKPGEEPLFADPEGTPILKPWSIMMISGAHAVDWNRDGDLDLLTGQGHGGSGLRFFERDYLEDTIRGTRPRAKVERLETAGVSFLDVVRRYADAMMEHGRDVYGEQKSGLFLSALDRTTMKPLEVRPAPPGGIRREDRAGLPWLRLAGANPQLDENLLRVFYCLTELTGDRRYGEAADQEIKWFFQNAQSPVTGLLPWGEHLAWDVFLDRAISSSTDFTHEFSRPWALWEKSHELAHEACLRFALGLWNHQVADQKTGGFDRHAPYDRHGPQDGKDFPRHAGFYIDTWAHAFRSSGDETFLRAIEVLLARFERKRTDAAGAQHSTIGPLDAALAAGLVPEPLSSRLRAFAEVEDRLVLEDLRKQFGRPDGGWAFRPTWQAGYSSGVTADWAMFALARHEQSGKKEFREIVLAVADAYRDSLPEEDVDVWPMSMAHVISAQVAAYRFTDRLVYLEQACRFGRMAVRTFWQDRPLPRASFKTDHYETITGADSLALALLEVHAATHGLKAGIPTNTIDR